MPVPVSLFHRDFGGTGDPLVILHGMLGSSRNWQAAGKDLAQAGWRVFAPDFRNHGSSPHAPEMDYEVLMADLLHWLDQQGLSRVHLLGHSMGGKTAMLLACRHPDRVSRLTIVDIAPKSYRWAAHRMEFAAMEALDLEHLTSRAEAEIQMESRVSDWAMRKFLVTNLDRTEAGTWRWIVNLPAISGAIAALEGNPLQPGDRYDGPTRFIIGGRSNYVVPAQDTAVIQQYFPAAEILTIADSGHNPHFEQRAAFLTVFQQP